MQSWPKSAACWSPRIPAIGHARAENAGVGVRDPAAARNDLGKNSPRNGEEPAQLGVPQAGAEVHEHRARGVAHVGDVPTASGQLPDQPGVDCPGGEPARRGFLPRAGNVVEQPPELGSREVRIENETGLPPDDALAAGGAHPIHRGGRSPVLPDDRAMHGPAGFPVPENDRLALVRDADRGERVRPQTGALQGLPRRAEGRLPDLLGVVLDPAGLREVRCDLLLRGAELSPALVEDDRARARSPLIESENVGHCRRIVVTNRARSSPRGTRRRSATPRRR